MLPNQFSMPARPKLGERDFNKISTYIERNFGIRLPLSKLILVESRLIKRIIKLNVKNFSEYVDFVFSKEGIEEQVELIDFLCTNKTDFFREVHHFNFLEKQVLGFRGSKPIKIWSSACSSGEEPYTIAMVLEELKSKKSDFDFQIFATDISSSILQKARRGEYALEKLGTVPKHLQKRYFDADAASATISTELKRAITFEKFNLVDDLAYVRMSTSFDFIFCRNVLIYFDQATQARVVSNLISKLLPGGILCLGHSETLLGRNLNLQQLQPTIYQKPYA